MRLERRQGERAPGRPSARSVAEDAGPRTLPDESLGSWSIRPNRSVHSEFPVCRQAGYLGPDPTVSSKNRGRQAS